MIPLKKEYNELQKELCSKQMFPFIELPILVNDLHTKKSLVESGSQYNGSTIQVLLLGNRSKPLILPIFPDDLRFMR